MDFIDPAISFLGYSWKIFALLAPIILYVVWSRFSRRPSGAVNRPSPATALTGLTGVLTGAAYGFISALGMVGFDLSSFIPRSAQFSLARLPFHTTWDEHAAKYGNMNFLHSGFWRIEFYNFWTEVLNPRYWASPIGAVKQILALPRGDGLVVLGAMLLPGIAGLVMATTRKEGVARPLIIMCIHFALIVYLVALWLWIAHWIFAALALAMALGVAIGSGKARAQAVLVRVVD